MISGEMDYLGMTKKELAKRLGIKKSVLKAMLGGRKRMTIIVLARIAYELQCTVYFDFCKKSD